MGAASVNDEQYENFLRSVEDAAIEKLGMEDLKAADPMVAQMQAVLPAIVDATIDALIVVFNSHD